MLIATGLITLWQLLLGSSASGDVWLGQPWQPPAAVSPATETPGDCDAEPSETAELGEDSTVPDADPTATDTDESEAEDSCAPTETGDTVEPEASSEPSETDASPESSDDNSGSGSGSDDDDSDED